MSEALKTGTIWPLAEMENYSGSGVSYSGTYSLDDSRHMSSRRIHEDESCVYYRAVRMISVCAATESSLKAREEPEHSYAHTENKRNLF